MDHKAGVFMAFRLALAFERYRQRLNSTFRLERFGGSTKRWDLTSDMGHKAGVFMALKVIEEFGV